MILIGMYDSPYARRVAISATLLGFEFEHRNWSVGKDAERIRQYNPQGRVPVWVLDSGESLIESAMILDWLDQQAGPQRALLPATGEARTQVMRVLGLCAAAIDKGIQQIYERLFRPADKRHEPWIVRCSTQMHGALAELERFSVARENAEWLVGATMTQADITLACYLTYLRDAVPLDLSVYPSLQARAARCEAQPVFARFYLPFDAPVVKEAQSA